MTTAASGQAPQFIEHPSAVNACVGEQAVFNVEVNFGSGADVTLNWQFDGMPLNDGDRDGRIDIVTDLTNPAAAVSTLTITDINAAQDPGAYRCLASTSNNGSTLSNIATLTLGPTVDPTSNQDDTCRGDPVQLSANATGSGPPNQFYFWSIVSGPSTSGFQFSPFPPTAHDVQFTPNSVGTYVIRVETSDAACAPGGEDTAELVIESYASLAADPSPAQAELCVGFPLQLHSDPSGGDGDYTLTWIIEQAPAGGENDAFEPNAETENPTFTPTQTGTYVLSVTVGAEHCSDAASESVMLDVSNTLAVTAAASQDEICQSEGTVVQAVAQEGATYAWTVSEGPNLSINQFANPNGATTIFTPSAAGDYVLQVQASSGQCLPGTDTVPVTVHEAFEVTATAESNDLCLGESIDLDVDTGGSGFETQSIQWTMVDGPDLDGAQLTGATTSTPTFTPTTTTDDEDPYVIEVEIIDPACVVQVQADEIAIDVYSDVTAAPAADPSVTCEGTPVTLDAAPAGGSEMYTYTWSIAAGPSTESDQYSATNVEQPIFTPEATGDYLLALVVEDAACLEAAEEFMDLTANAPLAVNPQSDIVQSGLNYALLNQTTTLHANLDGGVAPNVIWNIAAIPNGCAGNQPLDDPMSTDPDFTPACTGTYRFTLVVTDDICGMISRFVQVNVIELAVDAVADVPLLCYETPGSDSTTLHVEYLGGAPFFDFDLTWEIVGGPDLDPLQLDTTDPDAPIFTPNAVGDYVIRVDADDVNELFPTITDEVTVGVNVDPPAITTQPVDATACVYESISLSVAADGVDLSYQWRLDGVDLSGADDATLVIDPLLPSDAGTYACVVSNGCGQEFSDEAVVIVDPPITDALLVAAREDDRLRQAQIVGCQISGDLLNRGFMGAGIQRVTGLDTHPITGEVFAAVRTLEPSPESHLARINPFSGAATVLQPSLGEPIVDIAFDAGGVLYAIRGNHPCPSCSGGGSFGEVFTLDTESPSLTPLTPPLVMGALEGHTIAFDDGNRLYHHGLAPGVSSQLRRIDLESRAEEVLYAFANNVSLTAMTIHEDVMLAARRFSPSELWSLDHAGETYAPTNLGPIDPETGGDITVFGLAFACALPAGVDCDGDVDLDDYTSCFDAFGDADPQAACLSFDFDDDADLDLLDWGHFQHRFGDAPSP